MTYKEQLTASMAELARDPLTRFVGYGLRRGRAGGTLRDVPDAQILETPVAENLMTGLAIGQSLAGLLPVLYFERFDFALNAADAIVNHLDAADDISRGEFKPAVIIRVVVGNTKKPLFTGRTHTRNHYISFSVMCDFPVLEMRDADEVAQRVDEARNAQLLGLSAMLIEYKDLL